jgi:hypothetical protein
MKNLFAKKGEIAWLALISAATDCRAGLYIRCAEHDEKQLARREWASESFEFIARDFPPKINDVCFSSTHMIIFASFGEKT